MRGTENQILENVDGGLKAFERFSLPQRRLTKAECERCVSSDVKSSPIWRHYFESLYDLEGFEFYVFLKLVRSKKPAPFIVRVLGMKLGRVRLHTLDYFTLAFRCFEIHLKKEDKPELCEALRHSGLSFSCRSIYRLTKWICHTGLSAALRGGKLHSLLQDESALLELGLCLEHDLGEAVCVKLPTELIT